jgi:hypothetical protein
MNLYEDVLFHGESLAFLKPISTINSQGLTLKVALKGQPEQWSQQGLQKTWVSSAPLLDAVFQAAIVWSHVQLGLKCLPNRLSHWHMAEGLPTEGEVQIKLQLEKQEAHSLKFQVVVCDSSGDVKARMESIEMVLDASLASSFAQNRLSISPAAEAP